MEVLEPYLADIWLILIGFFLLYYAVTDGSDLGVGILSFFSRDESERGELMGSVVSTWHGNQTWLVLLGGMLFGAFPLFYSLIASALYIPIVVMLFGLLFRGVAFEFYEHSDNKPRWGLAFSLGSLIAAAAQGFCLGGLLWGLEIKNGQFVGSVWGWFTPFSILVTLGVLVGYAMLGSNYLIMKSEGTLQDRSYRYALRCSIPTLLIAVAVHSWVTFRYAYLTRKWTTWPDAFFVAAFSLLTVFAFLMFLRSLRRRFEVAPLLWNGAIILFSFITLSIGLYPTLIPDVFAPTITVTSAAASAKTLAFMLTVTAFLAPIILSYTVYEFWVFRGKTKASYHLPEG